jgi:DNA repair protein RadA/Sms
MSEVVQTTARVTPIRITADRTATPITEVSTDAAYHWPSGVGEFDRVLGGGIVPGAAILLSGEPGVGKSTLLLEVASRTAAAKSRVLYVSAEESAGQVRLRAERTGALHPNLFLAAETDLASVIGQIDAIDPQLVIVDSVQTIASASIDGIAGGPSQVREVTTSLIRVAKERALPILLVGHVTKDGQVAGPRVLEHLVDVVCQFEGDRQTALRFVRALKNRFGPTDEVGCFEMSGDGIVEVPDPSGLFLSRSSSPVSGTCVTVAMEGKRAIPVEVQALVVDTSAPNPRRVTSGVDAARLAMLLAVLEKRAGIHVSDKDVYVSTVGGVRLTEPAADLAIAIAVASAVREKAVGHSTVAFGEISLAGEVRKVVASRQRTAEATRMGFRDRIDGDAGGIGAALRLAFATGLSERERELDAAF